MQTYLDKHWFRQLIILALGAISSFAMQPYEFWPVLILGLSGFWFLMTENRKIWQSYLSGFLFAFGYFVAGLWWVGNALLVDGNPYLWALPLAVFGLQALLSFFILMAAGLSQTFAKGRSLPAFLFFVAMMSFWEWGRGHMFTGFPWNLFGMTWTSSLAMSQIASVGGIHFLNLATVFAFTLPAFLWKGIASKNSKIAISVVTALLIATNFIWGSYRLPASTDFNKDVLVQLVTPNIAQKDKWNPDLMAENFWKTVRLMRPEAAPQTKAALTRAIVLPETALLPEVFSSPEAMNALRVALNAYPEKTYLLSGALRREQDENGAPRYFNSLIGMGKDGKITGWFDKFHLVPFGEYIPFQKYVPFGPVAKFAGFQGGKGPATWTNFDGLPPFSPLICYEVIFAGQVTNREPQPPQWMVNVTNDAWYGISPGPHQHLAQTQFRAIEEGIPVIRSTNTGISAIIDSYGHIVTQSPLYQDFVQEEYLPRPASKTTIYAVYKDKLFFFSLFLLILPVALRRIKRPT